jgi:hypothetical protein
MSSFIALGFLGYLVIRFVLQCCFASFWSLLISSRTIETVFTTTNQFLGCSRLRNGHVLLLTSFTSFC